MSSPMLNEPKWKFDVKLLKGLTLQNGEIKLVSFLPYPCPKYHKENVDINLGQIFKSSKWRNKW